MLRFDDVGVGPAVACADGDDRRVDGRELPHPELAEADEAEQTSGMVGSISAAIEQLSANINTIAAPEAREKTGN